MESHDPESHDHASSSEWVKIRFPLPEEDQAGGVLAETLWAVSLGGGRYRLENIPFYIYGVSAEDVVSAENVDGFLEFREVVSPSGHSTYRVFPRDPLPPPDVIEERLAALRALGTSSERGKRLITLDVPPDADIDAIYRVFEYGDDVEKLWSMEEAHYGRR
jgi:hypothetical protein